MSVQEGVALTLEIAWDYRIARRRLARLVIPLQPDRPCRARRDQPCYAQASWRSLLPNPQTLFRWHRELVPAGAAYRRRPPRPRWFPGASSMTHNIAWPVVRTAGGMPAEAVPRGTRISRSTVAPSGSLVTTWYVPDPVTGRTLVQRSSHVCRYHPVRQFGRVRATSPDHPLGQPTPPRLGVGRSGTLRSPAAQPSRSRLQVAALGQTLGQAGRGLVAGSGTGVVAGHLEHVRPDRVQAVAAL